MFTRVCFCKSWDVRWKGNELLEPCIFFYSSGCHSSGFTGLREQGCYIRSLAILQEAKMTHLIFTPVWNWARKKELGSDGVLDHLFHLPVADPRRQAVAGGRNQRLVRLSAYTNPAEVHGVLSRIWSCCYQKKSHDKLVLFGAFSMCIKTCFVRTLLILCGSTEAFWICLYGKHALTGFPNCSYIPYSYSKSLPLKETIKAFKIYIYSHPFRVLNDFFT